MSILRFFLSSHSCSLLFLSCSFFPCLFSHVHFPSLSYFSLSLYSLTFLSFLSPISLHSPPSAYQTLLSCLRSSRLPSLHASPHLSCPVLLPSPFSCLLLYALLCPLPSSPYRWLPIPFPISMPLYSDLLNLSLILLICSSSHCRLCPVSGFLLSSFSVLSWCLFLPFFLSCVTQSCIHPVFTSHMGARRRHTRAAVVVHKLEFVVERCRTAQFELRVIPCYVREWNGLPSSVCDFHLSAFCS